MKMDQSIPEKEASKVSEKYLQEWKDNVSYGRQWIVETVFSGIKRLFAEYFTSI